MEMICYPSTDPNAGIAGIASSLSTSLSSSPLASSKAIQHLLDSPILNNTKAALNDSDTKPADDDFILVPESPPRESRLNGNVDEMVVSTPDEQDVSEVPMTQMADSSQNGSQESVDSGHRVVGRSLKRQSSICMNNLTSSPRAMAILRNAIKSSATNKFDVNCDNNNDSQETSNDSNNYSNCLTVKSETVSVNGSPTNDSCGRISKTYSPFSRGSAFLRAAKQRMSKDSTLTVNGISVTNSVSPQIANKNSQIDSVDNESNGQTKILTSILRKHELDSSPTSGEPKNKKKKVLFAEPVVTSEVEFECSPLSQPPNVRPLRSLNLKLFDFPIPNTQMSTSSRKRNNLVHQDSTFQDCDNACDSQDNDNDSDSPLLLTQLFSDSPLDDDDNQYIFDNCVVNDHHFREDSIDSGVNDDTRPLNSDINLLSEENSSYDRIPCSQAVPTINYSDEDSKNNKDKCEDYSPSNSNEDEDVIVNVPMRLSLIRELYNLFGQKLLEYS